jgi:hypothetical protein
MAYAPTTVWLPLEEFIDKLCPVFSVGACQLDDCVMFYRANRPAGNTPSTATCLQMEPIHGFVVIDG